MQCVQFKWQNHVCRFLSRCVASFSDGHRRQRHHRPRDSHRVSSRVVEVIEIMCDTCNADINPAAEVLHVDITWYD